VARPRKRTPPPPAPKPPDPHEALARQRLDQIANDPPEVQGRLWQLLLRDKRPRSWLARLVQGQVAAAVARVEELERRIADPKGILDRKEPMKRQAKRLGKTVGDVKQYRRRARRNLAKIPPPVISVNADGVATVHHANPGA
jgi:hypothetical protein